MKAILDSKLDSYNELQSLYEREQDRFNVIPAFKNVFEGVTNRRNAIVALMQKSETDTTDTTEIKGTVQDKLCEAVALIAAPVYAYAQSIGDLELQATMNVTKPRLMKEKQGHLEATCSKIINKANELKAEAAAFNLTASLLTDAESALAEWIIKQPSTGTHQSVISTSKENIAKLAKEMDGILKKQLDKMVLTLTKSDPDLASLWNGARKVEKPQRTVTQLVVSVLQKEGSKPIGDALVVAVNGIETPTRTNGDGEAIFKPIKNGRYDVKVNADGFEPATLKSFRIVMGKVNRVEMALMGGS